MSGPSFPNVFKGLFPWRTSEINLMELENVPFSLSTYQCLNQRSSSSRNAAKCVSCDVTTVVRFAVSTLWSRQKKTTTRKQLNYSDCAEEPSPLSPTHHEADLRSGSPASRQNQRKEFQLCVTGKTTTHGVRRSCLTVAAFPRRRCHPDPTL